MITLVGGTWDENGGKPSKIVSLLKSKFSNFSFKNILEYNGGYLEELKELNFSNMTTLIWMPNIDNSEDKILDTIKKVNPHLFLVSSKRVVEKDYSENDVVGRLLKSHSNLGIMIEKKNDLYNFKVLDPLGNMYNDSTYIGGLALVLSRKITHFSNAIRLPSKSIGDLPEPIYIDRKLRETFEQYGQEFTKYVNAINPNRFLGNAATRCSFGFPAVRTTNAYYVSKRNIDKANMSSTSFVKVLPYEDQVLYYGNHKPSVDTPIDIKLFNYYSNVNVIIHGHVYTKNGLYTNVNYACGDVREFKEIISLVPDNLKANFSINLKGHGCLILANSLDYLKNVELIARPFPERI